MRNRGHGKADGGGWMPACAMALCVGLLGCSDGPGGTSTPSENGGTPQEVVASEATLRVEDAKAHFLPGGHGAIYFTVQGGGVDDRLVSIETTGAGRAELHETFEEDGVMRMRHQEDGFAVEAESSLILEPGGKHVMLMDASAPESETLPLTLHFELAGVVDVAAQVHGVPGSDGTGMDHGSMDHGSMDHGSEDSQDHGEMEH